MLENKFILNSCKYLQPDYDLLSDLANFNVDYIYILGQILYNRVGGVAYHVLEKSPLMNKLNREFKNTLKTIYETNIVKSESYKKSLGFLADILFSVNFPYALLKGSYLVSLYPMGLRTSNDIDILINFKDITAISNLLLKSGFIQGYLRNNTFAPATRAQIVSSQMNRGETVPFVKEVNYPYMKYLEVDLNFSLDFKPEKDSSIVEKFLDSASADIKTNNGELNTLSKDDFLIQLCSHLYKEATVYNWVEFGRDQGLYKYLDIYLILNTFENIINYEKINELGLQKECYYALFGVNKLFDMGISLDNINISDTGFLNEIIDVSNKKTYKHDMNFIDWVFYSKRKEMLYEITI